MNITITKQMEDRKIILTVKAEDGSEIVKYSFFSRTSGTEVGTRLVLVTLLRYSIMMTLNVSSIFVDFAVDEYEKEYLCEEVDNLVAYCRNNQGFEMKRPSLEFKGITNAKYDYTDLDRTKNFIGYSGGKDSQLCLETIQDKFSEIVKFKIDFETESYEHDYNERIDIIDEALYNEVSTAGIFAQNNKDYYQEEDLHCCFAIPYYGVKASYPQSLTIGLQFDVINDYLYDETGKKISEFDLLETFDSVRSFEKLMNHYGLEDFRILVPLASLTSFSIYNILLKKYGEDGLRKFNSCWTPDKNGEPCGVCLKCQRVAYIYDILGMEMSKKEQNSLELIKKNNTKLDFLFGSITCEKLLEESDDKKSLADMLFVDDKIEYLDWGLNKELERKYGLIRLNNPFKGTNS